MIIGFDGSRAFSKDKTGTEIYSYQVLKHLSKIDPDNSYYIYLRPNAEVNKEDWPQNFHFKIINWPRLWTQGGLSLQTFKDKIDVLFVPAHTIPLIYKPGLKIVVTVHDLGSEYLPQMHQLKQRLYLSFMQNTQLKMATKLIAVSESTKRDLINRIGISPDKIEVIYEGFDTQVDSKGYKDVVYGKYFLFVGTIQPRKNLERLIKAFVNVPAPYKLILAGSKGWLADHLYELPEQLKIENRVKFLGRVSDQDLNSLYKNAFGFIFPSLYEGFGLPILEAFAHKIPVITSNTSSMPEVAGKGAILVNPESIEEIQEAMVRLISEASLRVNDSDLRKKLIMEGQKQLTKFSWEKCARQTLKLLKEVSNKY